MIVIEIYSPRSGRKPIASFVRPIEDALKIADAEIKAGNRVEMRRLPPEQRVEEFDMRAVYA